MMPPLLDELLDLVKRLVMGFGFPFEEFPYRQGMPVKECGYFPNREILFPHILHKPFSQIIHYGLARIIIST